MTGLPAVGPVNLLPGGVQVAGGRERVRSVGKESPDRHWLTDVDSFRCGVEQI